MDVLNSTKSASANAVGFSRRRSRAIRCAGLAAGLTLAGLFGLAPWPGRAQDKIPTTEPELKAQILCTFAEFVEWPANTFTSTNGPIRIGILGKDPFGDFLRKIARLYQPDGRTLHVTNSTKLNDLKSCHLLFVCASEKSRVSDIIKALEGRSVLTVSDMDDFFKRGGVIRLYRQETGKEKSLVRYEINAGLAQTNGLKVNSQLIMQGQPVGSVDPRGKE